MIQSYKQKHQAADSYDTILIGSGLGSLTTAVLLAKAGQKVLVLERHYTAGGFMRKRFLSFSDRTTREVLESITQSQ